MRESAPVLVRGTDTSQTADAEQRTVGLEAARGSGRRSTVGFRSSEGAVALGRRRCDGAVQEGSMSLRSLLVDVKCGAER
eukprot:3934510-Rhodomonas_salina.5